MGAETSGSGPGAMGKDGTDAVIVLVTGPDAEALRSLGRTLVSEGLAACVNVLPGVRSVFRWKGEIQEEDEALAVVKSTRGRARRLQDRVLELHPYDEPEFLALPVWAGSPGYLEWISRSVGAVDDER